jgi:arylsulfatase A-like enzyme
MLISWPRYIPPGTTTDKLSAFWDWLPTFAELAGAKLPHSTKIDGISLAPLLTRNKKVKQGSHHYLFWEFTEGTPKMAIRFKHWKAIWFYEKDGITLKRTELYNLAKDPGEENNLASTYPETLKELATFRDAAHSESSAFPFQKPKSVR